MLKRYFIASLLFALFFLSKAQNIYTYAGTGVAAYSGDAGPAISADIKAPQGLTIGPTGDIYLSDTYNFRIRKIDATGIITTVAGGGTVTGDGGQATLAGISAPVGITFDATGNIYIAEYGFHRIRKINTSGIITTVAGTGSAGFGGDGGPATSALLKNPSDIALDLAGNLYISDFSNHRIRMVNTSGIISTIAGTTVSGFSGDGGLATSAQLNAPTSVEVDASNNVYISDGGNARIRKINNFGIINTIVGTTSGNSGDGGLATAAQIGLPKGIKIDAIGNLYISDYFYSTIRKVNTSGIINTITGTGTPGYSGDGNLAAMAQLNSPFDLTIDALGNIYVADASNNRVRIICISSCLSGTNENASLNNLKIFPNPTIDFLFISNENHVLDGSEIEITNYLGQIVLKLPFTEKINVSELNAGFYTVKISSKGKLYLSKFVKESN